MNKLKKAKKSLNAVPLKSGMKSANAFAFALLLNSNSFIPTHLKKVLVSAKLSTKFPEVRFNFLCSGF